MGDTARTPPAGLATPLEVLGKVLIEVLEGFTAVWCEGRGVCMCEAESNRDRDFVHVVFVFVIYSGVFCKALRVKALLNSSQVQ